MIRVLLGISLTCALWIGAALAQESSDPIIRAELAEETVMVGQPVILRVTVLVPTWMPSPPQFPTFEMPNMIVRLPERASGPVSETVNGETWSGVSRAYRLYPMVPGAFAVPPQTLALTYADPDTTDPIRLDLPIPAVSLNATVPEGAEALDPLLVASKVTLSQTFEGPQETLTEGDAVKRIVTAKIDGSSALFLPPMIAAVDSETVQAYAEDPALSETENRGLLSGQRTEIVTYVARYGGVLELPEIALEWFNTETGKPETVTLEGAQFAVDAPAAPREPLLTRRQITLLGMAAVIFGTILWGLRRWAWPVLRDGLVARAEHRRASEAFAAERLKGAIRARDLHQIASVRAIWDERAAPLNDPAEQVFDAALIAVGAAAYGGGAAADWPAVQRAFDKLRKARLDAERQAASQSALPPLNPF